MQKLKTNCTQEKKQRGKMENVPIVLAQYRLGKTLGIGAFGKVKCEWFVQIRWMKNNDNVPFIRSGTPYNYGPQSRRQNSKQRKNKTHGNGRKS
jgi:hypothetical protein